MMTWKFFEKCFRELEALTSLDIINSNLSGMVTQPKCWQATGNESLVIPKREIPCHTYFHSLSIDFFPERDLLLHHACTLAACSFLYQLVVFFNLGYFPYSINFWSECSSNWTDCSFCSVWFILLQISADWKSKRTLANDTESSWF